jgi:MoaA/NifB/PqqE/SkfB family radical SAM enzyme
MKLRLFDLFMGRPLGSGYQKHQEGHFVTKKDLVLEGILDGSLAFSGPQTVQFDVTNRCNNNCLCCWNNSPFLGDLPEDRLKEKEDELPLKLIKKIFAELKGLGTKNLVLAGGGEPFMHPKIIDILGAAKKCNFRVSINTNFTLIDEKIAKKLVDLKIDLIHVSLLAGTPKTYAVVHPNKTEETFLRIVRVLRYMVEERNRRYQNGPIPQPHIDLYYVIFNKNYRDIRAMTDLAMDLRVNTLEFTPIDVIPGKTDVLLLNEPQKKEVLESVIAQKVRLEEFNRQNGGKVTFIEQYDPFIKRLSAENAVKGQYESTTIVQQPCYVGWAFARILANGNVTPCLKAHRVTTGNIYKQKFRNIWNSPEQQLFRKKAFMPQKNDQYLRSIGNNPSEDSGCLSSCDNIQINIEMHAKYHAVTNKNAKS